MRGRGVLGAFALALVAAAAAPAAPDRVTLSPPADGRLESLLAALSSAAGRAIVLEPTPVWRRTPALRAGARHAYEGPWPAVLAEICARHGLGVERLRGGTLLLTTGPQLLPWPPPRPDRDRTQLSRGDALLSVGSRAERRLLIGPGLHLEHPLDGSTNVRETSHWHALLRRLAGPSAEVRAVGDLVLVGARPLPIGVPVEPGDHDRAPPPPDEGARIAVRAQGERLGELCARVARAGGRDLVVRTYGERIVVAVDLPELPWRDALDAVATSAGLVVEDGPDGLTLRERRAVTLMAHAVPLADWLTLLAEAAGTPLRVSGPLAGRVTADVQADPAALLTASLALWRCEASRAEDGALVVKQQPGALPSPSRARADADVLARVDAIVETARAEAAWDPRLPTALGQLARERDLEADPEVAWGAWLRVPPEEPALAPLRRRVAMRAWDAVLVDLQRATTARDAERVLGASARARALLERGDLGPSRRWEAHLEHALHAVHRAAPFWPASPDACLVDQRRGVALAIADGALVRAGDEVRLPTGAWRVRRVELDRIVLEQDGAQTALTVRGDGWP